MPKNYEYYRAYDKARYVKRRKALIEKLGGKCSKCGSMKNLEIDHVDYRSKEFDVSGAVKSMKADKLQKEADKCQLLCERCHNEKSITERWLRPMQHGTLNCYTNGGCRCDLCREIHSKYQQEWRNRTITVKYKRERTGLVHGTANAYAYYKCRCDICRLAHNKRMKEQRDRRKMRC